MLLHVYVAM